MDWDIFVDETGNFSKPEQAVLVCGVLVPRTDSTPTHENVANAFRRAYPGIPLPHHASDLKKAAGQLAAWVLSGRRSSDHGTAHAVLEALIGSLGHRDPKENARIAAYRAALERGVMPGNGPVHAANRALVQATQGTADSVHLDALEAEGQAYAARVRAELGRLVVACPEIRIVASGEGRSDAALWTPPDLPPQDRHFQDRYLRLVEVLTERALMLLRTTDAAVGQIHIHASYRDLDLGNGQLGKLTFGHVKETIRRAAEFAWPTGYAGPAVRLAAMPRYDASASPWFAVADFAASRVLAKCKLAAGSWSVLASHVEATTRISPEVRCSTLRRPCPGISASGAARESIALAWGGRLPEAQARFRGTQPHWARMQASTWIASLGTIQLPGGAG